MHPIVFLILQPMLFQFPDQLDLNYQKEIELNKFCPRHPFLIERNVPTESHGCCPRTKHFLKTATCNLPTYYLFRGFRPGSAF